jgi:hypothetical protein
MRKIGETVKYDMKENLDYHSTQPLTFLQPLDLPTPEQKNVLVGRFGGQTPAVIEKALGSNESGKGVLTKEGRLVLKQMTSLPFQHVASNMRKHKRRNRGPTTGGDLILHKTKPGEEITTDSYPTSIKSTPTFQVVAGAVVPVGWVMGLPK